MVSHYIVFEDPEVGSAKQAEASERPAAAGSLVNGHSPGYLTQKGLAGMYGT